jgi:hypothetical protein
MDRDTNAIEGLGIVKKGLIPPPPHICQNGTDLPFEPKAILHYPVFDPQKVSFKFLFSLP